VPIVRFTGRPCATLPTEEALPRLRIAAKALGVEVAHLQAGEAAEIANLVQSTRTRPGPADRP